MSRKSKKHGLTLVELVLAILLVNVVILTGLSMEMGMRKLFTGTDFTSELTNEAVGVLQMVTKVINRAIGVQTLAGYRPFATVLVANGNAWSFWQDSNGNGVPDLGLDNRSAFRYFSSGPNQGQVAYYNNVANINGVPTVILTTRCIGFTITDPAAAASYGFSNITLRLRRDILTPANASNPELYFVTKAQYLSTSFS